MSEGKWVGAKHGEIKEGDVVRVTFKEGPKTTITEGKVTKLLTREWNGQHVWSVENFENFYQNEFEPDDDGEFSTLEKFVPPFQWPTKLGALITFTADGDPKVHKAILIKEDPVDPEDAIWWTEEWGEINKYDLDGAENLTVVFEGVTLVP